MELKVLQISDLHFCMEHLEESSKCMDAAIEYAHATLPQVIAITGDSTHHRLDGHSRALRALAERVRQLSNIAPVILLQGTFSHEPVGTIEMLAMVEGRFPIMVVNRLCQFALMKDGTWDVSEGAVYTAEWVDAHCSEMVGLFTGVPTLNKAVLASNIGAQEAAFEMGKYIHEYLLHAGKVNRLAREYGVPTVGLSHGTVHGCETEHGVPMMGFDHEFTSDDLFDAECSAFMLGHIHKHQVWMKEGRLVSYAGSNGRFHYGELGVKGFLDWRIKAGSSTLELIPAPAREMMYFDFSGPPALDELREAAKACHGAFVRVQWQVDVEHSQAVTREQVLEIFSDAREVKIQVQILKIQRSRSEGISQLHSDESKLVKWAEITAIDSGPVVDRLTQLTNDSAVDIANALLDKLKSNTVAVMS